jgi:hypothetical protein
LKERGGKIKEEKEDKNMERKETYGFCQSGRALLLFMHVYSFQSSKVPMPCFGFISKGIKKQKTFKIFKIISKVSSN